MLLRISLLILLYSLSITLAEAGGIQIGRTRVIYNANDKEVALPVINKGVESPWLVQAWIDTGDGKTRGPFIITPPLFRLDAQKEQSLRIMFSGAVVPEAKESLFYINVRTIPASDKGSENKNLLRLIYKTRLKMFYRPQGLQGTPTEACENLQFTRSKNTLRVDNPSVYHTVFDSLFVDNHSLAQADIVPPGGTVTLALPASTAGNHLVWRCISDYGNATNAYTRSLNQE